MFMNEENRTIKALKYLKNRVIRRSGSSQWLCISLRRRFRQVVLLSLSAVGFVDLSRCKRCYGRCHGLGSRCCCCLGFRCRCLWSFCIFAISRALVRAFKRFFLRAYSSPNWSLRREWVKNERTVELTRFDICVVWKSLFVFFEYFHLYYTNEKHYIFNFFLDEISKYGIIIYYMCRFRNCLVRVLRKTVLRHM